MLKFDAAKHEYKLDGTVLPSVTQVLQSAGLVDATWFTEWARNRGSQLHKALELLDKGTLDEDTLDDELKPFVEQYKRFKDDSKVWIVSIEKPVYQRQFRYAGTIDRQFSFKGSLQAIIDIKTNSVPKTVGIQLAAYQHCLEPRWQQAKRFSLQITKTGYKLREHSDKSDFNRFLQALEKHNASINC